MVLDVFCLMARVKPNHTVTIKRPALPTMSSTGGGVFSQTLQTITTTKLEELFNKRTTFEERYQKLQLSIKNEDTPLARLCILIEGVQTCFGAKVNGYGISCSKVETILI